MTKPKPSDIPKEVLHLAKTQLDTHLYERLYNHGIAAYKRRWILWFCGAAGIGGGVVSLGTSLHHGAIEADWIIYILAVAAWEGFLTFASIAIAYLGFVLLDPSHQEPRRLQHSIAFLLHHRPPVPKLAAIKAVANAGAAAGQTRTIPAIFLLGFAASLFGKDLFRYIDNPMITYGDLLMMGVYSVVIMAIIGVLSEIQQASSDTEILKAIAYYEEYLAEEAHNPTPAPIQPAVASTPAPTAKLIPTAAKTTTSHGQQSQPKQTTQTQPQRKKKRR